ncbi:hypothetical protein L2091_14875 [Curtobacterium albidum]|uniref:hypothetical protein n=1 Tax=Curtobacterium citreum TaxID=2036 RepID=UPI0020266603|nr:hypothetical protein [Curtobacterium albidum]MCL9666510.1 hypothetical protein [Curtobacterium albidum]
MVSVRFSLDGGVTERFGALDDFIGGYFHRERAEAAQRHRAERVEDARALGAGRRTVHPAVVERRGQ